MKRIFNQEDEKIMKIKKIMNLYVSNNIALKHMTNFNSNND